MCGGVMCVGCEPATVSRISYAPRSLVFNNSPVTMNSMAESDSANCGSPRTPDRWWVNAVIAAILTAIVLLLVIQWPTGTFTWIISGAVFVFAVVIYFNPRHWLKRRSGVCLGIASASVAIPAFAGSLSLQQEWIQGLVEFSTEASPWITGLFGCFSLGFAWLDRNTIDPEDINAIKQLAKNQLTKPDLDAAFAAHEKRLLAKFKEAAPPDTPQDESNQRYLADAVERLAYDAQRGAVTAQRIIQTDNPGDVADYLIAKRNKIFKAKQAVRTIDSALDIEAIQLDRELAAVAYTTGRIDEAEQALERILEVLPDDLDAINRMGHTHRLRGRLDDAKECYSRLLVLKPDDREVEAVAYGNLGLIYKTRGDLDEAEKMFNAGLEIDKELDRLEGMAAKYGNLGLIYRKRGDLDEAERMHRKSLDVNEELDRIEGMANQYAALGLVENARGNLDEAEKLHKQGLDIEIQLGRQEGIARQYGNLGLIYQTRGDLEKAEKMYRKSLEISEPKGLLELSANQYGNLGLIYQTRGDLDEAERMHRKALEIDEQLGRKEGMASQYGNLGLIYQTRGDLDEAERMHRKALDINEQLGCKEGVASDYANLGLLAEERGKMNEARELWIKARDLYARIGMPNMVEKMQVWVDKLDGGGDWGEAASERSEDADQL